MTGWPSIGHVLAFPAPVLDVRATLHQKMRFCMSVFSFRACASRFSFVDSLFIHKILASHVVLAAFFKDHGKRGGPDPPVVIS